MKRYIGTQIVHAEIAANPKDGIEGYKVVYADGHTIWSPMNTFKDAYLACDAMTFGLAVEALKMGKRVSRTGWNDKNSWLKLISKFEYSQVFAGRETLCAGLFKHPCILQKTSDDCFAPWSASQRDMLAEDWVIIE